jgi:hypothetical protein
MGRTPNIDRIGREGCLLTDHYGQPSCTAGRSAFIMGQLSIRTGMTTMPGSTRGIQTQMTTMLGFFACANASGTPTAAKRQRQRGSPEARRPTTEYCDLVFVAIDALWRNSMRGNYLYTGLTELLQ